MLTIDEVSALPEIDFSAKFGGVYESSQWVARRVFGIGNFTSRHDLCAKMRGVVDAGSDAEKLALINAHPDLAGKLARAGALTAESTREQAGLGLDRLDESEFREFHRKNATYRERFGFPFIICARRCTKAEVLAAFDMRQENSRVAEILEALEQIHQIASLRLADLVYSTDLPAYTAFLPEGLLSTLWKTAEPCANVPGLRCAPGLRSKYPEIETDGALQFIVQIYRETRSHLHHILQQRQKDREFMDRETLANVSHNADLPYTSPDYKTVIGQRDEGGRIVVGPLQTDTSVAEKVEIPEFLKGDQITLFGPPDTAKMAINAMNALHRRLPEEPAMVAELVASSQQVPRWGADNEDSKTPIMEKFLEACQNLTGCFEGTLSFTEQATGKRYDLAESGLSKPIKRIPGLALPDGNHLLNGSPLPLHLFDFALHLWHNRQRPEALVFYIPKLENEEEAAYIKALIDSAETLIKAAEPTYHPGTVKLFIVFENPRAIFRIREIANVLHPHFLGGSLGWHDFLASTARLFKNDPRYRIPVKADPNIVIHHIRESHRILAETLAPLNGIRIGGMYGVLYEEGDEGSYEVCISGFIRDVTTQLKRGLNGFWVAHPAFVRVGLALVEAWRRGPEVTGELVKALVPRQAEHGPLLRFIAAPDAAGLDSNDPIYLRSVLAATIETSDVIANDHPDEIRYNIFQALQYLCDWLCGNGCVALPASMKNYRGEKQFVRVMDDLATTERSRWELWAEVYHRRVSIDLFDEILAEEAAFIRNDTDSESKRIQVRWTGAAAEWYPLAVSILRELVVTQQPVEFVTEKLMPYTLPNVREEFLRKSKENSPKPFYNRYNTGSL